MSIADRLASFGVTIFSEMTALALEHDAINLGQGFPNWDGAGFVKEAAARSLAEGGTDQYPPSQGIPALRQAIAVRYTPLLGRQLDPAAEVTITCGCTEALAATFLGLIDPGEEVILIEPFYDAYPVFVSMTGAVPRYVTLRPPEFQIDLEELRSVFSPKTKAIVLNNPHNPTGRVFTDEELSAIAALCVEYDAIAITDEVYEEMVYDGMHRRLASYEGMWERTLTLSSIGKTFSLTGWKVGWGIGPPGLTVGLRAAHQFLTFTTPTPVQNGAVAAMAAPPGFYEDLRRELPEEEGPACRRPRCCRIPGAPATGDVLHDGRVRWLRLRRRPGFLPPHGRNRQGGGDPTECLLSPARRWGFSDPVRLLQGRGDTHRGLGPTHRSHQMRFAQSAKAGITSRAKSSRLDKS